MIDGITFLVVVRLNEKSLKIMGENKSKREMKVIEIERNEGL